MYQPKSDNKTWQKVSETIYFYFSKQAIVEIQLNLRFFDSAFGLSPYFSRNAFKAMVSTISR